MSGNAPDEGAPPEEEPKKRPLPARARAWARMHRRAARVLVVGAVAAVVLGVLLYLHFRSFESTDDAQIDGDISMLGARVGGTVVAVYVNDNQTVKAGDLLAELDPADYLVGVAEAEANVTQVEAQTEAQAPNVPITEITNQTAVTTTTKDVTSAHAELAAARRDEESAVARRAEARARSALAQIERARSERLVAKGVVAPEDLDQRTTAAQAAAAELAAAEAAVEAARKRIEQQSARLVQAESRSHEVRTNAPKQLDIERATLASHEAAVKAAHAALERARLDLTYTKIIAPVDGVIGRKSINVGDRVQPGEQLLALVQLDHLWVTANFKETQLARMRPGQAVRVSVDAYGDTLSGKVESMPGASGARFSLFPPENATGNYVKVVQRLPVRIRLDPGQAGLDRLRPGMSVEPKVYVR